VVLEIASEDRILREGDSAHFRGNVKHNYHNRGKVQARGIVTILDFPDVK
jgi:quercetin dioxygenase-like cupin family protein